jgi:hypothetical protein
MPFVHAQEKRFEYKDSAVLEEPSTVDSTTATESEEKDILSDTTLYISNIVIPQDSLKSWKANKRFAYVNNIDSLLKLKQQEEMEDYKNRLKEKPNNFLSRLFSSGILQVLFWMVAIGFVVFILYRLFLSNGIFKREVASRTVNAVEEEPVIATVADYDKLIHQSVKLADYRMAVRYLFLKTLASLADKELLHYAADKTNYQYVQEIRDDKRNEFASLVLNYEYIWYGNFSLTAELFTAIEKKFSSFNNKI